MLSNSFAYLLLGAAHVYAQQPLRIVSFNIRYANEDINLGDVERYWLGLTCTSDTTQCRAPGVIKTLCRCLSHYVLVYLEANHGAYRYSSY